MRSEEPAARPGARTGAARARAPLLVLALAVAWAAGWAMGLTTGRHGTEHAAAGTGKPGAAGSLPDRSEGLQDLGLAPSWTLTDQNGRTVSSDSLRGKALVVTFLFPYCRTYCPLIAAHLRGLEGTLRRAGLAERVRFVAFDVDPAHTGPREMRAFLRQYGWDPAGGRFLYLTGSEAEIRRVVTGGFHIEYRRVEAPVGVTEGAGEGAAAAEGRAAGAAEDAGGDAAPQPLVANALADRAAVTYDVVHNDAIELVGPDGRIRRYYGEADRIPDEQLLEDIRALLREQPER
jgi:protein SCO1/2